MLVNQKESCILIFSMQKEFLPSLINCQYIIDSCCWLVDLANYFSIPVMIIEHKNLGASINSITRIVKDPLYVEVIHFSCLKDNSFKEQIMKLNKKQFILAGAESHIAILQSALDLKENGYEAFVVSDAITARNDIDHQTAINRFNQLNIPIVTKEMVFFELIDNSEYPNYIDMSLKFLDRRYIRE